MAKGIEKMPGTESIEIAVLGTSYLFDGFKYKVSPYYYPSTLLYFSKILSYFTVYINVAKVILLFQGGTMLKTTETEN